MYHRPSPRGHRFAPTLWFFTDPARTPDPVAIARALPRGAVIVYRHFGAADRVVVARRLRALPQLVLLIGLDWRLAAAVGADGVHMPERELALCAQLKRKRPDWIVSAAVHSAAAIRKARGADFLVLSPVFPSRSPTAAGVLGIRCAQRLVSQAPTPVIALGGVRRDSWRTLRLAGFAGMAGIDLFAGGPAPG